MIWYTINPSWHFREPGLPAVAILLTLITLPSVIFSFHKSKDVCLYDCTAYSHTQWVAFFKVVVFDVHFVMYDWSTSKLRKSSWFMSTTANKAILDNMFNKFDVLSCAAHLGSLLTLLLCFLNGNHKACKNAPGPRSDGLLWKAFYSYFPGDASTPGCLMTFIFLFWPA